MMTDSEYYKALDRVKEIFDAEPNTPKGDELEKLILLIMEYEKRLLDLE